MNRRRAAILPMVLFTILLVGLLGAVFAFRVHSDVAATEVLSDRLQSRLAAEAGVEWAKALLRAGRHSPKSWYHNPDAFHRVVLWAADEDAKVTGTNEEFNDDVAYRFSIVADDPTDDEDYIRFGLTDEASKLNVNTATEAQLTKIVTQAAAEREDVDVQGIVNAILDWRDGDNKPRGEAGDTEGPYYRKLAKPYRVKNGPLDTVEELLLVKGVTPELLFGEDFDRNGLLTPNEDDGGLSFPPDNQDNLLNRGMYPYLTVVSYETNNSSNNRPRAYLFAKEDKLRAELELILEGHTAAIDFVIGATRKPSPGGQPGGPSKPDGEGDGTVDPDGGKPGEEGDPGSDLPPPPGEEDGQPGGGRPNAGPGRGPVPMTPGGRPPQVPDGPQPQEPQTPRRPREPRQQSNVYEVGPGIDGKQVVLAQLRDPAPPPSAGNEGGAPAQNPRNPRPRPGSGVQGPGGSRGGQLGPSDTQQGSENPDGQPPDALSPEGASPVGGNPGGQSGTGDGGPESRPIRSPADLMFPRKIGGNIVPSPLTPEDLALLMDATTVHPPEKKKIEGLINVNTAPREVLECLAELTDEQIEAILTARDRLDEEQMLTPVWLVTEGILDLETFAKVAPQLTARAQQFTIESLGYADHQGMVTRLQVVVDMFGPIAQPIYVRDISYLGATYPIREKDLEQQRAH